MSARDDELSAAKKRIEELEAVLVVCEKLGMRIEDRPAFEGFALRNVRAQEAEAEVDALKEQLEAVKKQRNAAIMTLDKVSALTDRKGEAVFGPNAESVVESVKRVVDELAALKARGS